MSIGTTVIEFNQTVRASPTPNLLSSPKSRPNIPKAAITPRVFDPFQNNTRSSKKLDNPNIYLAILGTSPKKLMRELKNDILNLEKQTSPSPVLPPINEKPYQLPSQKLSSLSSVHSLETDEDTSKVDSIVEASSDGSRVLFDGDGETQREYMIADKLRTIQANKNKKIALVIAKKPKNAFSPNISGKKGTVIKSSALDQYREFFSPLPELISTKTVTKAKENGKHLSEEPFVSFRSGVPISHKKWLSNIVSPRETVKAERGNHSQTESTGLKGFLAHSLINNEENQLNIQKTSNLKKNKFTLTVRKEGFSVLLKNLGSKNTSPDERPERHSITPFILEPTGVVKASQRPKKIQPKAV